MIFNLFNAPLPIGLDSITHCWFTQTNGMDSLITAQGSGGGHIPLFQRVNSLQLNCGYALQQHEGRKENNQTGIFPLCLELIPGESSLAH